MFSAAALYPLEVIKTNLQAQTKKTGAPAASRSAGSGNGPLSDEADGEEVPLGTGDNGIVDTGVISAEAGTTSPAGGQEGGVIVSGRTIASMDGKGGEMGSNRARKEERDSAETRSPSVTSVAREIYSREGIPGFYNGVFYASGQSGLEKAAYFYGYGWLRALALRGGSGAGGGAVDGELSAMTDLGLGYLAEAFHLPFTIPIEVRALCAWRVVCRIRSDLMVQWPGALCLGGKIGNCFGRRLILCTIL